MIAVLRWTLGTNGLSGASSAPWGSGTVASCCSAVVPVVELAKRKIPALFGAGAWCVQHIFTEAMEVNAVHGLHGANGSQCSSWSWLMLAKAGSDDAVWCSEICLDCILFCSGILKDLIVGTSENVGPSVFINLLCPLVLFLWLWLGKRGARANCRAQSRAALLLGLPYQAALRRLHQFCASERLLGTWEERFFRNPECMHIGISYGAVVEAHVTLHVLVIAVTKIA